MLEWISPPLPASLSLFDTPLRMCNCRWGILRLKQASPEWALAPTGSFGVSIEMIKSSNQSINQDIQSTEKSSAICEHRKGGRERVTGEEVAGRGKRRGERRTTFLVLSLSSGACDELIDYRSRASLQRIDNTLSSHHNALHVRCALLGV